MRTWLTLAFASIVAISPLYADRNEFETDTASSLKYSRTDQAEPLTFRERHTCLARFRIAWEHDDEGGLYLRALFLPDDQSRLVLPYERRRGPVEEVWIRNMD
jgi:hypothetical protein